MLQQQLTYKNSTINYYVFGNGEKALLCLHGYGKNGLTFSFLEKHLSSKYTFFAIDLPFHGCTKWNEKRPIEKRDLISIFNSINTKQKNKFSILAYSMGGRVALSLLPHLSKKIEHVVLIAPDGLHVNFWYRIATKTLAGNTVFESTMHNPKWFFKVLNVVDKTNLLNKSIIKFIHYFLDDERERMLLFRRWNVMKKLTANIYLIKKMCTQKNIHLNFLFGKYDRIIPSYRAAMFKNLKHSKIKIIEAGHYLLNESYANEIISLLET